jgi:hypothetical protein
VSAFIKDDRTRLPVLHVEVVWGDETSTIEALFDNDGIQTPLLISSGVQSYFKKHTSSAISAEMRESYITFAERQYGKTVAQLKRNIICLICGLDEPDTCNCVKSSIDNLLTFFTFKIVTKGNKGSKKKKGTAKPIEEETDSPPDQTPEPLPARASAQVQDKAPNEGTSQ